MIDNTKHNNKQIAYGMAVSSLVFIYLLICNFLGVFSFSSGLTRNVLFGIIGTLSPVILLKLKVPDNFLKFYMSIMMALIIGSLGSYSGIGIYITFVLVPIASCLYFEVRYTIFCSVFSYIVMAVAVYFNSASKFETLYLGWSHFQTFQAYMIGFTLEYVIVILFLRLIVKRAWLLMEAQRKAFLEEKAKEERYKKRLDNIYEDSNRQNSIFEQIMSQSSEFTEEELKLLSMGHRLVAKIAEDVKYQTDLTEGIKQMLESIVKNFDVERICVVENDSASGYAGVSYQWDRDAGGMSISTAAAMTKEDVELAVKAYETCGYIEFNPAQGIITDVRPGAKPAPDSPDAIPVPSGDKPDIDENDDANIAKSMFLGNQIWLPMLENGRYVGAVGFDRHDTTPYTQIERLLLAEIVNVLSAHIIKINAEKSNQAKSVFLSTMSHEIRTPMNAIIGLTEVALREDMPASVKENLDMVKSSAYGLLTLINDLLDYSKIEAGKFDIVPEEFSPLEVIYDLKKIVQIRNAEKLTIKYEVDDDLPSLIYGDFVRIKQVMLNFCTNAIKYSDDGQMVITASFKKTDDEKGRFFFSVKDNGIGISEEDLPRLFDSYTRLNTTVNHHKEGTGLGLTICKQLVKLMDGEIGVESQLGKGSTFSFEIPLKVIDWSPAGSLNEYSYSNKAEEIIEDTIVAPDAKILIVDDTFLNLSIAEALMRPTQMNIDTAESGQEALELIEANDYDLIFMDHFMPEMDGAETTSYIRKMTGKKSKVPVVALTADAVEGVREEMLEKGMDDFLAKPIMIKELNQILRKWLPAEKIK